MLLCQNKVGRTVQWRNNPHLMGWVLLTASVTPAEPWCSAIVIFLWVSPGKKGQISAPLTERRGGFSSALFHGFPGALCGCSHPHCCLSGQSHTCMSCATSCVKDVPEWKGRHQRCRHKGEKPLQSLCLSYCLPREQLANKSDVFIRVSCFSSFI